MKFRTLSLLAALSIGPITSAQAQGFVFGTAQAPAKTEVAAPAGARNAKVETAQRLLARMGLLREAPTGMLTPATQEAIRTFSSSTIRSIASSAAKRVGKEPIDFNTSFLVSIVFVLIKLAN